MSTLYVGLYNKSEGTLSVTVESEENKKEKRKVKGLGKMRNVKV